MSVRMIIGDGTDSDNVALYDSVSGTAFGPVFATEEDAQAFLDWLPLDARTYSESGLREMRSRYVAHRRKADV